MRHYSEQDLEGLVTLEAAIDGLARAFAEYAAGTALVQPRVATELGGLRIATMAAMIPAMGCCGAKVYTAFRGKFSFIILLFSAADGQLLATFDAGTLTRLRTAAASALAARYLARSDSRELTVFGTGAQAAGHVQALAKVLPITAIRVVGRARAAAFAREMSALTGVPATVEDAVAAVRGADVIVTATRSMTPLFDGALVQPGCFIAAVGSARADAAEIDAATFARCARVVVESKVHALHEAGDLVQAVSAGALSWDRVVELGALVTGAASGRQTDAEITLFDTVGFALEDVAIASIAHARLAELGKT
jgi:ornithine cyclodeaminase